MTTAALASPRPSPVCLGRTYLHPAFDYLVIGGGFSLLVTAFLAAGGGTGEPFVDVLLSPLFFLSNSAHFAASTVRLYTKPGSFGSHPFLTMGLPLASVAALTLALRHAEAVGGHLLALYLTWSPFHYAAQAYGLAVMYCYRSGYSLGVGDKRLIRLACLLPFFFAFFDDHASGFGWLVPAAVFTAHPSLLAATKALTLLLGIATLVVPVVLFACLGWRQTGLPLISLLVIVSNGVWWVTLRYLDAFIWATIFHGLQYLAITLIFHAREQLARPENRRGWPHHALRFYGLSLLLGYALFTLWPHAYRAVGFGWVESILLVGAVVNIHHFVVDAYIWRLRRDTNYKVVTGAEPSAA